MQYPTKLFLDSQPWSKLAVMLERRLSSFALSSLVMVLDWTAGLFPCYFSMPVWSRARTLATATV